MSYDERDKVEIPTIAAVIVVLSKTGCHRADCVAKTAATIANSLRTEPDDSGAHVSFTRCCRISRCPPCLSVIVSLCSSFARVRSYVRVVAHLCLMFPHIPHPNIFLICFFLCCSRRSLCMSFISARVPGCLLLCASQDSVPYNFSFFSIVHTSFFGIVHISFIRPAKATDSSTSSNCLLHFGTKLARLEKRKTPIGVPTYFRRFVSYTCLAALSLHRGS